MDEVGFSKTKKVLDGEHQNAMDLMNTALDNTDILNDFEQSFAKSIRDGINRHGNAYELSSSRKDCLNRIEAKLERANLL